jgi:hypothetical protein
VSLEEGRKLDEEENSQDVCLDSASVRIPTWCLHQRHHTDAIMEQNERRPATDVGKQNALTRAKVNTFVYNTDTQRLSTKREERVSIFDDF